MEAPRVTLKPGSVAPAQMSRSKSLADRTFWHLRVQRCSPGLGEKCRPDATPCQELESKKTRCGLPLWRLLGIREGKWIGQFAGRGVRERMSAAAGA